MKPHQDNDTFRRILVAFAALALIVGISNPVAAVENDDAEFDSVSDQDPRIIGGSDADPADYPFYVQLTDQAGKFVCGGSLIRSKWVLTAAHCVDGEADDGVGLRFGVTPTSIADEVVSKRIYVHPRYNDVTYEADIAIIKLQRAPDLGSPLIDNARFARKASSPAAGTSQEVIGFGLTTPFGNIASKLQVGTVKIKACQGIYGSDTDAINVCAGGYTTTSCQGDSGGPLVLPGNVVGGIVSYGTASCIEPYGVYTRVGTYAKWIDRITALRCEGRKVTVDLNLGQRPTRGDDVILGTPGDDRIYALGGNDTICAGGGNDVVLGGPGSDRLFGGPGRDKCWGGSWKDYGRCEVLKSVTRI